jgi:radical SAM protein with 4Fe4S-binding SPASM domain
MNKIVHITRLAWAYKFRKTDLSYPPYQFTIEPTNICNLRCNFCPQSDPAHRSRRPTGKLSLKDFEQFLHKRKTVSPGNRNLNFTLDGEPFLNRDFIKMVELAVRDGLFPIFASNGTRLNEEIIDRLAGIGPFGISIDFSPDADIFESIRGKDGDYHKVLDNLVYITEKAGGNPNIHLVINDISGFSANGGPETSGLLRGLLPEPLPPRVRLKKRNFHNFCGHLEFKKENDFYRLCPYPWTQMAVTWDGKCVPCCRDTAGRSVLGNVFRRDIMAIWNGEPYRQFRRNLVEGRPDLNAACRNCELPYRRGDERWKAANIYRSLVRK